MALFYGVGHWNAFFNGLIYLRDRSRFPLQLILRDILIQSQVDEMLSGDPKEIEERMRQAETIKYGVIIVASVPVMLMYPFVQRHFVKGIMVGSIKG
jgi:ABC-type glycerol-3-phosphate transport system permease component